MAIKHAYEVTARAAKLKAATDSWWQSLSTEKRKAYLAKHPKSKRAHTSVKPGIYQG